MADQLQLRGGTTSEHSTFTGALREVTVDTDKDTLIVHDAATAGGHPLLREDGSNSALALGTQGTPSLKFAGQNTGIYSPGTNQVAISTGGSARLYVDSTGKVSLGTISPVGNFVVSNGGAQGLEIFHSSVNNAPSLQSYNRSTSAFTQLSFNSLNYKFRVSDSDAVEIDSSGRVGIGTSSPGSYADYAEQLVVATTSNAGITVASATNGVGALAFADGTASADHLRGGLYYTHSDDKLQILSGGGTGLTIDSSQRVGVGTTTPTKSLEVAAGSTSGNGILVTGSSSPRIVLTETSGGVNTWVAVDANAAYAGTISNHPYAIYTNSLERLRIDSSGRVGVGTSSPSDQLDTAAASYRGITLKCNTTAHRPTLSFLNTADSLAAYIQAAGNSLAFGAMNADYGGHSPRMTLTSTGLGVGTTSPNTKVHIVDTALSYPWSSDATDTVTIEHGDGTSGINLVSPNNFSNNILFSDSDARAIGFIQYNHSANFLRFNVNNSERLRIDSSGSVGIGTSSPLVDLHVSSSSGNATSRVGGTGSGLGLNFDYDQSGNTVSRITANTTYTNTNAKLHICVDGDANPNQLVLDGAGRVGIGTTAPDAPFHVNGASGSVAAIIGNTGEATRLEITATTNNNVKLDVTDDGSNRNLVFAISGSEAARVDSSKRLLVGTSTARDLGRFEVEGTTFENSSISVTRNVNGAGDVGINLNRTRGTTVGSVTALVANDRIGAIVFRGADGTGLVSAAQIKAEVDGTPGSADMPGRLVFSTTADGASSPTERMRITSGGLFKATTGTSTSRYTNTVDHAFINQNGNWITTFEQTSSTSSYGLLVAYTNRTPNNTGDEFLYCADPSALRFSVRSNGGIVNYQSNDANLCDEREKKNIETLDSTWGCLKNWELKKFHYNEDADTDDKRYGVIAQQVAPHCPEVITDWVKQKAEDAVLDEDGNVVTPAKEEIVRMGVKEQQMMWMAIKALQEAQTRIETLEAEVAALKGA
jgi:hypothetical protein